MTQKNEKSTQILVKNAKKDPKALSEALKKNLKRRKLVKKNEN